MLVDVAHYWSQILIRIHQAFFATLTLVVRSEKKIRIYLTMCVKRQSLPLLALELVRVGRI